MAGQAVACALHLIDQTTGQYDANVAAKNLPGLDVVVIEWARREQGIIVAPGNPVNTGAIIDLRTRDARVAIRQEGSSSALLLSKLVADAGFKLADLRAAGEPVSSETDVAVAVREGKADAGLAIAAAAREQGLDCVPLQ